MRSGTIHTIIQKFSNYSALTWFLKEGYENSNIRKISCKHRIFELLLKSLWFRIRLYSTIILQRWVKIESDKLKNFSRHCAQSVCFGCLCCAKFLRNLTQKTETFSLVLNSFVVQCVNLSERNVFSLVFSAVFDPVLLTILFS